MDKQQNTIMDKFFFVLTALCIVMLIFEAVTDMQFFYLLPETVPEVILAGAAGIFLAAGLMIRRHFILGAIPGIIAAAVLLIGLGAADLHSQHTTISDSRIKGGTVVISQDDYLGSSSGDIITADIPVVPYILSRHRSNSITSDTHEQLPPVSDSISITGTDSGFNICYNSQPIFSGTSDSSRISKIK